MKSNDLVYCSDCVNWDFAKKYLEYFGCCTDCFKCPCGSCSCINPEKEKKFEDRPMFIDMSK